MKALEWIKDYSKTNWGFISGGYALHKDLGTEYTDIDFYCAIPVEVIDTTYVSSPLVYKKEVVLNGVKFETSNEYDNPKLISYKGVIDEECINLVMVMVEKNGFIPMKEILNSFDMDILRLGMTKDSKFESVDIKTGDYLKCLDTKIIYVKQNIDLFGSPKDTTRIKKYQTRLPDYTFVRPI